VSSWRRSSSFLFALLLAGRAFAQDAVVVTGKRTPVDKSYRKMVRGMDLFQEMHALAPGASLRYRLYPRKRTTDMERITVSVVGETFRLPVPVSPDSTFVIERDRKAWDMDALVRANRGTQSMTWRAEVRTPGVPADTRRLGDLRLECLVGMEADLVSHYPSFMERVMTLFQDPRSFCGQRDVPYLFFAERPLFGVTLISGVRTRTLPVAQLYAGLTRGRTPKGDLAHCDCEVLLDRAYYVPLGDRSWPDDTLVKLEYMDSPPTDDEIDATLIGGTKADIVSGFGKATVLHFDSGFEVWAYPGPAEMLVLFDPSGLVTKVRLSQ